MGLNYKCLGRYESAADRLEGNIIVGVGCVAVAIIGFTCLGLVAVARKFSPENFHNPEPKKPHSPNDGL